MKDLASLEIKAMIVQSDAFRTGFYDGKSLQGTQSTISDYDESKYTVTD